MKILFIGPNKQSSKHKYLCLKKLYKDVDIIDGHNAFLFNRITERIFGIYLVKYLKNKLIIFF